MNRSLFYLSAVALALSAGFLTTNTVALLAIVGLLAVGALFCIPRHWLPALALATFVLLPVGYLSEVPFAVGRYITPSLVIIIVWLARSVSVRTERPKFPTWTTLSILTVAWLAYSTATSIDVTKSAMWTASFVVLIVLVGRSAFRVDEDAIPLLVRTWLWLGVALGLLGLTEGLLGRSLFGNFYVAADGGFADRWSVHRITTTLGHPLMNGTFFAVTATLALFIAIQTRSKLACASALLSAVAVAFTVSRSATFALIVGVSVGVLLLLTSRGQSFGRKFTATVLVFSGALALLNSSLLAERSGSAEGASSSKFRDSVVDIALRIAEKDNYLGSGIGTSNLRAIAAGQQFTIENSYLGVMTSAGIPGALLICALLLTAIVVAMRRRRVSVAAALVAYAVVAAGWPIWENVPGAFVIASALLILAFAPAPAVVIPEPLDRAVSSRRTERQSASRR